MFVLTRITDSSIHANSGCMYQLHGKYDFLEAGPGDLHVHPALCGQDLLHRPVQTSVSGAPKPLHRKSGA